MVHTEAHVVYVPLCCSPPQCSLSEKLTNAERWLVAGRLVPVNASVYDRWGCRAAVARHRRRPEEIAPDRVPFLPTLQSHRVPAIDLLLRRQRGPVNPHQCDADQCPLLPVQQSLADCAPRPAVESRSLRLTCSSTSRCHPVQLEARLLLRRVAVGGVRQTCSIRRTGEAWAASERCVFGRQNPCHTEHASYGSAGRHVHGRLCPAMGRVHALDDPGRQNQYAQELRSDAPAEPAHPATAPPPPLYHHSESSAYQWGQSARNLSPWETRPKVPPPPLGPTGWPMLRHPAPGSRRVCQHRHGGDTHSTRGHGNGSRW